MTVKKKVKEKKGNCKSELSDIVCTIAVIFMGLQFFTIYKIYQVNDLEEKVERLTFSLDRTDDAVTNVMAQMYPMRDRLDDLENPNTVNSSTLELRKLREKLQSKPVFHIGDRLIHTATGDKVEVILTSEGEKGSLKGDNCMVALLDLHSGITISNPIAKNSPSDSCDDLVVDLSLLTHFPENYRKE